MEHSTLPATRALPGGDLLTDDDIAAYDRDGYIKIDEISPPDEVAWIRNTLLQMIEQKTGFEEGALYDFIAHDKPGLPAQFPSFHNPSHFDRQFARTQYHRRATAIAKRLLGKDAKLYGEHALLKPSAGPATPWHQDESFRSPDFEYRELSIWLALQPVTKESGCMQFIPGSNHYEVLTHQSPGGDKTLHPLECIGDFPVDQAVAVPLNAGGCTVHHMRTLHHTAPNTTKGLRLAYILIFNVPPVYRPGTRQFPWLEGRRTDNQNRSQEWLRKRGVAGYLTEAVRLLPRARLTNPRWLAWAAIRAASKITRRG